MKHKIMVVGCICLIGAAVLAGCGAQSGKDQEGENKVEESGEGTAQYHKITAKEAKKRIDENSGAVIVDVRTQEEFDEKHIPGAVLIPNDSILDTEPSQLPDKDMEILLYCRSGNRSREAAEKLVKMGYTKVYDFGGINDWTYETASKEEENGAPASGNGEGASATNTALGEFSTRDLDDKEVTQEIFAGKKLTMVNVWATFCGPCLREMPDLGEIQSEYSDKDFQIVGVIADAQNADGSANPDQVSLAKEIIGKTKADYTHLLISKDLAKGRLGQVMAVPETFFVDGDGNQIGQTYSGAREKKDWTDIIDGLLEKVNQQK